MPPGPDASWGPPGSMPPLPVVPAAAPDQELYFRRDTHWRPAGMSRAFGPGLPVPRGATALDLARERQEASRWSTQTHAATVKRLQAVTPRRGWFGR